MVRRLKKETSVDKLNKIAKKFAFKDHSKYLSELEKLIEEEKQTLEEKGCFENKGEFWLYLETRPYMMMLYDKLNYLKDIGCFGKAVIVAEEMMKLSKNDNLGVRFYLFSLYAYFENKKILRLHKKFNDFTLEKLPVAIYFYKIGDFEKSKEIILEIKQDFPNLREDLNEAILTIEDYDDLTGFSKNDFSELLELVRINYSLFLSMGNFITEFI